MSIEEIDDTELKSWIKEAGKFVDSHLTDEQIEVQVEGKLKDLRKDPIAYFQKAYTYSLRKSNLHDHLGVFSCSASCESEFMWAHYGGNHQGFAVGFDTVEFVRKVPCIAGFVDYSDDPLDLIVFGNYRRFLDDRLWKNLFAGKKNMSSVLFEKI